MGKPLMIVQPDGEAAEIVRKAGAGNWVKPEDPSRLAATVFDWFRDYRSVAMYAENSHAAAKLNSRDRLASNIAHCNPTPTLQKSSRFRKLFSIAA